MIRSAASKVIWVGRATAIAMGLAVALALVLGVATMALAAVPGDPFKLGQINTINAITQLVGSRDGSLLRIDNNSSGAGAHALNLEVNAGKAPLKVNATAGKATNLDADKVDGQEASSFATDGELNNEANTRASADNQLQQKDGRIAQSTTLLQTIAPDSQSSIAEVTITVPGSEKQLVYVDGSVTIYGYDTSCPCSTSFSLRDKGTGQVSNTGYDGVVSGGNGYGQIHVGKSFAFVASPGTHTYEFRLGLSNAADGHNLHDPLLTATTVPFGGNGVAPAALSSFRASSESTTSEGNTPK